MRNLTVYSLMAVLMILISAAPGAKASPANPRLRVLTQPDGSRFKARLKGDEHFMFAETEEGYSVIKDDKTGYWTYADLENGLLVPTAHAAGKTGCPYKMHLRPDAQAVANLPQNKGRMINVAAETRHKWSTDLLYGKDGAKEHPSKAAAGRQYLNLLLGDFSDSSFAWYSTVQKAGDNPGYFAPFPYDASAANDHNLANAGHLNLLAFGDSVLPYVPDSSQLGTLTNYFLDVSYRKCWWAGTVDGPRPSGLSRSTAVSSYYPASAYVTAVLANADPYVNYDQNGDGQADITIIVHPGHGGEETGDGQDIWSGPVVGNFGTFDGVALTKLVFLPQNVQLGALAHETFNLLGAPDLYDYGYNANPWGVWSLMDMGCWCGEPVGGSQPSFAGGYLAYDIDGNLTNGIDGWLEAGALGTTDSISSLYRGDGNYAVAALDSAGEARQGNITRGIRLWRIRNNNFLDSGQVFFVENRRHPSLYYPYEGGLPESGIIISHIDTRMGTGAHLNDGPPCVRAYYSWVEQPGFDVNELYAAGDTLNYYCDKATAAYSADDYTMVSSINQTTLDSSTVPNSHMNKCYPATPARTGPFIYDISKEGPYMTFNVLRTGMASPAPLISYLYHTIKDPPPANNNGMLDPWENDTINIAFRNDGAAITSGASCSLFVAGDVTWYANIYPGWKAVNGGALAAGAQGLSGSFVVSIAKETPRFTNIVFGVKFRSTVPAKIDTFYFSQRVSPITVTKTYDFSNIYYGGTDYRYRLCPWDLAIYGDTLFVANANLYNAVPQTRIYKVKKSTSNNPLTAADTFGSLNNAVTTNKTNYICGMDVDNSGTLWYTMEDTVWNTNRGTTLIRKFEGPNTDWAGLTSLKRMRGLAFGPSVVDTVSAGMIPGDSLLVYWQCYSSDGSYYYISTDSIFNYRKIPAGTTTIATRWAFADSGWPYVLNNGYGWNAWNGRALENDGQNLWTSDIEENIIIQRDQDGRIIEMMPGPSPLIGSGVYGLAHEATNSAGVVYAPEGGAGAPAYVPYAKGNRHYLYSATLEDSRIYKIDATNLVLPTAPDNVLVWYMSPTINKIKIYKSDADRQKVAKYIIYRRDDLMAPTDNDSIGYILTSRTGGQVSPVDSFFDYNAKNGKSFHIYSVRPVNYSGYGLVGSEQPMIPIAIGLAGYNFSVSGFDVKISWHTSSENDCRSFEIMRSSDGTNYQAVGVVGAAGNTSLGASYSYTDAVDRAGEYYYQVCEVSLSGRRTPAFKLLVTVGEKPPAQYEFARCYPNPLSGGALSIRYALAKPGHTTLEIYNILGQRVKILINGHRLAGWFNESWPGTDDQQKPVTNGIYLLRIQSGAFTSTQKVVLLK